MGTYPTPEPPLAFSLPSLYLIISVFSSVINFSPGRFSGVPKSTSVEICNCNGSAVNSSILNLSSGSQRPFMLMNSSGKACLPALLT